MSPRSYKRSTILNDTNNFRVIPCKKNPGAFCRGDVLFWGRYDITAIRARMDASSSNSVVCRFEQISLGYTYLCPLTNSEIESFQFTVN